MHPEAARVVYRNRPYLVELDGHGGISAAFGPFMPGTEPSLSECSAENQVRDARLIETLTRLLPLSPELPPSEDTLAGG